MVPVGPHLLSHSPLCPLPVGLHCSDRVTPPSIPLSHVEYSEPPQDRLGWLAGTVLVWPGLASRTEPTINRGTAVASSGPEVGPRCMTLGICDDRQSRNLERHHAKNGDNKTKEAGDFRRGWGELTNRLLRVQARLIRIYGNEEIKGFAREITGTGSEAA